MQITRTKNIFLALAIAVAFTLICDRARATWYGENVAAGADIMMMDVRWPWWPESTYFANWNFATAPTGIGGYGGFAVGAPTLDPDHRPNLAADLQAAIRPGSVWSFWGSNKQGEPVRVAATSSFTYPQQYIGEGASGSLGGPVWPFIVQNHWYTMMMRVWEPVGVANPQYSYIGRWVKDVNSREWHLYGIMRLPVPATSFNGNAGFLEDFGNGGRSVRSMHRRLGYFRKDGHWLKSDTLTYDVPPKRGQLDTYWIVNILPEQGHEYLAMELSSNTALLPVLLHGTPLETGKKHAFTVKQPDNPTLDRPAITDVTAAGNGRQTLVRWMIPSGAAPQFCYRVELFANAACTGKPVAVREERMPTVREVLVDATVAAAHAMVRLTVTDVFDQHITPIVMAVRRIGAPELATSVSAVAGLNYVLLRNDQNRHVNLLYPASSSSQESRDEKHHWVSLAELRSGVRTQSGISRGFDTELRGDRQNGYAFRYNGLLRAPATGIYLLHIHGADGYRLSLHGHDTMVWDGVHGPEEKTVAVNLEKGDHPLSLDYFVDNAPSPFLSVEWEGPGIARQEIPSNALLHAESGKAPEAVIRWTGGKDGTAKIAVQVAKRGHKVLKTRLFLGKLQLVEADGADLQFAGPMPEGTGTVWARVIYDADHTVDSEPTNVKVSGPPITGWDFAVVGEAKALRGVWQTAADAFQFFGEGEYVISHKIQGDFTLTCRVDSFAGSNDEPVNPMSWAGLTVREDGARNNYQWGREFGIMQTSRSGLRTTPNNSDLGGARVCDYELPSHQPWLRVVRAGDQWTAWSSADGVHWEQGAMHYIPTRKQMDAGIVFRSLPQDSRAYFKAQISHITLTAGVVTETETEMPKPAPVKDLASVHVTGVCIAPSNPEVVVVRTSDRGLIRTEDGGKSWHSANGGLEGAANGVRSVAIDPTDPGTMLRAYGLAATGTKSESGGLMVTHDGGKSWQPLPFSGDFDGGGPSGLCGEVVAFDPIDRTHLYAACETRGFFRSEDSGKSWTQVGAVGDRITAITIDRWQRGNDGKALLHLVTCPDRWLAGIGLGPPRRPASETMSRDYLSRDGGTTLQKVCERQDLGYLNVAFDKGEPSELPYATTHGVLKALGDGERTFLFPEAKGLESMRPYTAIGCSGIDDGRCGRCFVQPLDPTSPKTIGHSDFFAFNWDQQKLTGDLPTGGMIAMDGELKQGKLWWFVATDGVYQSVDGGATLKRVLDARGEPIHRSASNAN